VVRHELGRLLLLVAELRVLVDLPAPLNHLLFDGRATLANYLLKVGRVAPRDSRQTNPEYRDK
jgi:hypothetical protein